MSELTPVEKYFEEKRSGLHPETLKNWPDKTAEGKAKEIMDDSKALDPEQDRPLPKVEPPRSIELQWMNEQISLLQTLVIGLLIAVFGIIIFLITHVADHSNAKWSHAPKIFKEAPPKPKVVYKTKVVTKVKKVLVASASDKWRRKYCYETGDWNACLVFKKNLPLRARVGRIDLLNQ